MIQFKKDFFKRSCHKGYVIALLLMIPIGAIAGFNGQSWQTSSVDGTNTQNSTLYTLAVSSSTATPTQVSGWLPLNGQAGAIVGIVTNNYVGSYTIDVSNDQSTIYSVVRDNTVAAASGGTGGETLNWEYSLAAGWKYVRATANPTSGYLAINARVFGDDINRTLKDGVPYRGQLRLFQSANYGLTPTSYQDFKMPAGAKGLEVIEDVTTLTNGATVVGTLYSKDPISGKLVSVIAGDAVGIGVNSIGTRRTVFYPQAVQTPPVILQTPGVANQYVNTIVSQDMVYGLTVTGTPTATTMSVGVKPIY